MSSNFFKSVNLIYYALLGGQLLFCLAAIAVTMTKDGPGEPATDFLYQILAPIACISTIIMAFVLNNYRKGQAKSIAGLEAQKEHYSFSVLMRAAILEAGSLFVIVMLFVGGGSYYYLIFFALCVGAFIMMRPSISELRETYGLADYELEQLM